MPVVTGDSALVTTLGPGVTALHSVMPALGGMTTFNALTTDFAMAAHVPLTVFSTLRDMFTSCRTVGVMRAIGFIRLMIVTRILILLGMVTRSSLCGKRRNSHEQRSDASSGKNLFHINLLCRLDRQSTLEKENAHPGLNLGWKACSCRIHKKDGPVFQRGHKFRYEEISVSIR